MAKVRVIWVDIVKIIAMIYIVAYHFFTSMIESGFWPDTVLHPFAFMLGEWLVVQLFFFCSGFLYQKQGKVTDVRSWLQNVKSKLIYLGVPYFLFSLATIGMKAIVASSVNNPVNQSIWHILFIEPLAPYWFLPVLFFFFILTVPIKNSKSQIIQIIIFAILYVIGLNIQMPYFLYQICKYGIWFVLGMTLAYRDWMLKIPKWVKYILLLVIPTIICLFVYQINYIWLNPIMIVWEGMTVILWIRFFSDRVKEDSKIRIALPKIMRYSMPVFLLQTICAAGFRIALIKIGITNAPLHVLGGLVATYIGPCILATIYWWGIGKVGNLIKRNA